ncbi:MAG: Ig-like domain-containing protein [Bacteroidales bacterium]
MKTRFFLFIGLFAMFFIANAQEHTPGTIPNNAESPQMNPEQNGLTQLYSVTGQYYLSADGGGDNADYTVDANKPSAGATVHRAYLMAATIWGGGDISDGCMTLDGVDINWDGSTPSALSNSNNYYADVTSIVGPALDAAAPGIMSFDVTECRTTDIDGVALLVIFSDPDASEKTIVIMFGAQDLDGDNFSIALGESINPDDPGALLNMGLGISYSYQLGGVQQYSIVEVNNERLSTAAGGEDDGISSDGGLMTVGGLGDSNDNPADPMATPTEFDSDDELYSILPFIDINTTEVSVFTENPSNDDNIFLAYFEISGAAIIGEGILISQPTNEPEVGTDHTITALIQDDLGNPVEGEMVDFEVISGPNAGTTHSEATDANGEAFFTFSSAVAGTDMVEACFENSLGNSECSNNLSVNWMEPQAESIVLTQDVNTLPIGNIHTVTATLEDELGDPIEGALVEFEVIAGPHSGTIYSEASNATGQAFFSYTGTTPGVDEIQACFENAEIVCSNILTFQWTGELEVWETCIPEGWSLISSPYQPLDPSLMEIFDDLVANDVIEIMLNKSGFWWPSQNINTLGNWNDNAAYKIKLNEEACVDFSLIPVEDQTFALEAGYNYLPVLIDQAVAAEDVFDQLGNDLMFAFELSTGETYWPAGGIFTLDVLQPGKGYIVNMTGAGMVDYNALDAVVPTAVNKIPQIENAPWTVNKTDIAHLISLQTQAISMFEAGDVIGAFDEEGNCVGMVQVQEEISNLALVAYGDDISTEAVDGLLEDESISFKAFDASENSVMELEARFDASMPDAGYFSEFGASAISMFKADALSVSDENAVAMDVYPNPTSGMITVSGIDANTVITVLNSQGQVVAKANASDNASVSLDLSELSKGVYLLSAQSDEAFTIEKIFVK